MKKQIIIFTFIITNGLIGLLHAQPIGHLSYSMQGLKTLPLESNKTRTKAFNQLGAGLEYRLKHRYYRVYWAPSFTWNHYDLQETYNDINEREFNRNVNQYALGVRFSIYPLNLQGDCNCPTWSRENPFFKRGWYLLLAPYTGLLHGVNSARIVELDQVYELRMNNQSLDGYIAAGTGLDIGVSPRLTLTPEVLFQTHVLNIGSNSSSSANQNIYKTYFNNRWQVRANLRIEYRFLER